MGEDTAHIESVEFMESAEHPITQKTDSFSLKRMTRLKISVLLRLGNLTVR